MSKKAKTNAIRKFDSIKAEYKIHELGVDPENVPSGTEMAKALGEDPSKVFKTLVTVGKSGEHYVFMIPVNDELDLKKCAAAVGEKNVEMIKSKELLGLTGYIHGGCSPVGMKKFFTTTIDKSVLDCDRIFFSGGRIGLQIETTFENLQKAVKINTADLIKIDN